MFCVCYFYQHFDCEAGGFGDSCPDWQGPKQWLVRGWSGWGQWAQRTVWTLGQEDWERVKTKWVKVGAAPTLHGSADALAPTWFCQSSDMTSCCPFEWGESPERSAFLQRHWPGLLGVLYVGQVGSPGFLAQLRGYSQNDWTDLTLVIGFFTYP